MQQIIANSSEISPILLPCKIVWLYTSNKSYESWPVIESAFADSAAISFDTRISHGHPELYTVSCNVLPDQTFGGQIQRDGIHRGTVSGQVLRNAHSIVLLGKWNEQGDLHEFIAHIAIDA